jgi:histidyl-tRNA synthetase
MNKENKLIPGLPSGFEDRWNKKLILKKKLINIIENNFIKFGFEPLETPSFEISENIGSFLADDDSNSMSEVFSFKDGEKNITLRYDLSSPLARFVAQNNQELPLPYKRYAIQNVFRNEKAGNARYREFTQADCDIVGNVNPAQANVELCNLIASTLLACGLNKEQFVINISNRKIVQGLIEDLKISGDKQVKVMRAIDKLDKPGFGLRGVEDLLKKERVDVSGAITKGADLTDDEAAQVINFLKVKDLKELKENLKNPLSQEGIKELQDLLEVASYGDYLDQIKINFTIVRGLAYYDGFCVETNLNFKATNNKGKEVDIGSICSGGQYNKLISRFKGVDIPGTGMSIGVDRLLFAMLQLDQIKVDEKKPVIVCVMDEKYLKNYYEILKVLRDNSINSEIFLDNKKNLGKQLTYANKKLCPIAVICGENEFKDNTITLKNLLGVKGENNQVTFPKENLIDEIKKFI